MFSKNLVFSTFVVVYALTCHQAAFAVTDDEIRESVNDSISELHPKKGGDWWKGLGPTAPGVIIAMYEKAERDYQKLRLLEGLSWFAGDPQVAEYLKRQADSTSSDVVRASVVRSIGFAQGGREADYVAKFLSHPDPQTRLAAAETLQGMDDQRARAMVDKYLTEEKTNWIVGRLKGSKPKALQPFTVSSSDDRMSPTFEGTWKGFLITPSILATPSSATGLTSEMVVMKLYAESASDLRGEISVTSKRRTEGKKFPLAKIQARRASLGGQFPSGIAADPTMATVESLAFQGELLDQAGALLLEIKVPKLGGIMVLKKEVAH